MNRLKIEQQEQVIANLVEGASIRSIERMTGIHRDTIMRLGLRVGQNCAKLLDETMRDLPCRHIQVDEIWGYAGKKQKQVTSKDDASQVGDFYTWVAIDADTKLVPCHIVGKRDAATAQLFCTDLASRLANRIQLSSDGLRLYAEAVENAFHGAVDYAMIVKSYEAEARSEARYSPPDVVAVRKYQVSGRPKYDRASTSFVERQNLTMRMNIRRLTRLTNAFSKKPDNLKAAVALHFASYNYCRKHKTLGMTPAMAAGIVNVPWNVRELLG